MVIKTERIKILNYLFYRETNFFSKKAHYYNYLGRYIGHVSMRHYDVKS